MSLKISFDWKQILKWGLGTIFVILFLVFFVKVATFEDSYYREKEGSERAEAVAVETESLDEEKPTKTQIEEYKVAADQPRYLSIPKLNIDRARIIAVGVKASGELGTPNNIFDVGWYNASGKPGQGGVMVIDGHNGGPHVYGVFKDLPSLAAGDIIEIERGDGETFKYKVVENRTVELSEANNYMKTAFKSPETGKESLGLISCTGEWSQKQGTYLSRQFTRAVLVD